MKNRIASVSLMIVLCAANQHALCMMLFADDFDQEPASAGQTNYNNFENWTVTAGAVDLVNGISGVGAGSVPTRDGLFVDLDGTAGADGTLLLRAPLALDVGFYHLNFDLGSTNRPGQPNDQNGLLVKVFGQNDYLEHSETVVDGSPFETRQFSFQVTSADSVFVSFASTNSNDNFGAVIDNVQISAIPIPATGLLLLAPLLGLACCSRRRNSNSSQAHAHRINCG